MYYSLLILWVFQITLFDVGVSTTTLTPNLGELCPGQDVVLTCSTTTESYIEWLYNGAYISRSIFFQSIDPVGYTSSLQASGFMFSAELISERPPVFATTLSFGADTAMNGDSVSCRAGGGQTTTQTIQIVQRVPSPPTGVRLTGIMNNSESASLTIEWDPPSQGGSPLNYTITTTPDLVSGPPPVTTSTSTTITINYNTDYTITVTASNCIGNGTTSDKLQFNFVNCSDPSPVAGVTFNSFSDTTEGANISFNCELGLEPQREDVSICCSNGLWVPDPAHRICSTPPSNCGQPVLSPNVRLVSTSGTTEGDTVTLQCEDGLFPVIPAMMICNSAGVWSPVNPAEFVCNNISANSTITVILVVVFFIIGVLGGFTGGALVVYGCYRWKLSHRQSKRHLPPSSPPPPAPLYEDIEISTFKCEVNENVAYGITSQKR